MQQQRTKVPNQVLMMMEALCSRWCSWMHVETRYNGTITSNAARFGYNRYRGRSGHSFFDPPPLLPPSKKKFFFFSCFANYRGLLFCKKCPPFVLSFSCEDSLLQNNYLTQRTQMNGKGWKRKKEGRSYFPPKNWFPLLIVPSSRKRVHLTP